MRLHESLHTKHQGFQLCHNCYRVLTRHFSEMWFVRMGRSNELLEICWRYFKLAQLATSKNYATDWVEGTKKQVCHQHHASVSEEVWVEFWTNRFCLLRISDCSYARVASFCDKLWIWVISYACVTVTIFMSWEFSYGKKIRFSAR